MLACEHVSLLGFQAAMSPNEVRSPPVVHDFWHQQRTFHLNEVKWNRGGMASSHTLRDESNIWTLAQQL